MRPFPLLALALGTTLLLALPAGAEPRNLSIGWLMVLDWDSDYPEAAECLVNHPDRPVDWTITHQAVYLSDILAGKENLAAFDLVVTTGHENHAFDPAEVQVLEDYVNAGGVLWFDDCGGMQIDNLPFGLEIDFAAEGGLPAWGTCFGNHYTVPDPDHILVNNRFVIPVASIRTDPGLNASQWFSPMVLWDPAYTVVIEGLDITYGMQGPSLIAYRQGQGKIVATATDTTCALECIAYGNNGIPTYDYHVVFNMLVWKDSDLDGIYDRDEDAWTELDTDGDGTPDYLDYDADDDGLWDDQEAGDWNPDTPPADTDGDGLPDFQDPDSDGDGIGDDVESSVDVDGNGLPDQDVDGDGTPNHLDDDSDGDGIPDSLEGDGDLDGDGLPNFADADDSDGPLGDLDGDGILNEDDNCPEDPNPGQLDNDGDGIGDACDPDDHDGPQGDPDTDGWVNEDDNCPEDYNPDQEDSDGDGIGDVCDDDPVDDDDAGDDDTADDDDDAGDDDTGEGDPDDVIFGENDCACTQSRARPTALLLPLLALALAGRRLR